MASFPRGDWWFYCWVSVYHSCVYNTREAKKANDTDVNPLQFVAIWCISCWMTGDHGGWVYPPLLRLLRPALENAVKIERLQRAPRLPKLFVANLRLGSLGVQAQRTVYLSCRALWTRQRLSEPYILWKPTIRISRIDYLPSQYCLRVWLLSKSCAFYDP